jgi:hypothetical protein
MCSARCSETRGTTFDPGHRSPPPDPGRVWCDRDAASIEHGIRAAMRRVHAMLDRISERAVCSTAISQPEIGRYGPTGSCVAVRLRLL